VIPSQLQNPIFRFIKVGAKEKIPLEKEWTTNANYSYDNPLLLEHIKNGGNYGILCGRGGLIVIDADTPELEEAIKNNLPETFMVRTGGGGLHAYYLTDDQKKTVLQDNGGTHYGEIQGTGAQVIAPTSTHPSGRQYEVVGDHEIIYKARGGIKEALKEYHPTDKPDTNTIPPDNRPKIKLDILDVVSTTGMTKHGEEYWGAHPIHGAKTGDNFSINPSKEVWKCFHHDCGGNALNLLAQKEGIIRCGEQLRGDDFKKTVKIAREKYGLQDGDTYTPPPDAVEALPEISKFFDKENKFQPAWLADNITKNTKYATAIDTGEILYYEDGVYIKTVTKK